MPLFGFLYNLAVEGVKIYEININYFVAKWQENINVAQIQLFFMT